MSVVLTVFIILASLLMIGIVLVQKSKGGGLASNFASSNQIMGVRKGQKVITGKYTGTEVKLDGEKYIIVRQSDILAIVE